MTALAPEPSLHVEFGDLVDAFGYLGTRRAVNALRVVELAHHRGQIDDQDVSQALRLPASPHGRLRALMAMDDAARLQLVDVDRDPVIGRGPAIARCAACIVGGQQ